MISFALSEAFVKKKKPLNKKNKKKKCKKNTNKQKRNYYKKCIYKRINNIKFIGELK